MARVRIMKDGKPDEMRDKELYNDVTVVGGGWSGILATKYMVEEGLSVVALEKRMEIGGVWNYSSDPTVCTVMKSTESTSSITVTEMSDFPVESFSGDFFHHTQVVDYLKSYVESFKLKDLIRCGTEVTSVEKEDDSWCTHTASGTVYRSRFVVVSTGAQLPNKAILERELAGFTGVVRHSIEVKEAMAEHAGQRVLVVGGGETAADVVAEWHSTAGSIHWSIRNGQQFFRKFARVLPWKAPQALDKASSRALTSVAPYHKGKPGLSWICKWTTSGSLLAYHGHGIPEWHSPTPYFRSVLNKNGSVLSLLDYRRVVPKGGIRSARGKTVTFADGSQADFDVVLLCTGYRVNFDFLPAQYRKAVMREHYKCIFSTSDPSLAFVGFVRPLAGSIPGVAELQSRLASKVFAGSVALPSDSERAAAITADQQYWKDFFRHNQHDYSRGEAAAKVEGYVYIESIARLAGVATNYWSLFLSNPKDWYVATFAPYNSCIYRLNSPAHRPTAIKTLNRHRRGTTNPLHLLLILFLRLTLIDWAVQKLGYVKYLLQCSRAWRAVRDYRVVRMLDYCWCAPKRALFKPCIST